MTQATENTNSQVLFHDERWGPPPTHNLILLEQFGHLTRKIFPIFVFCLCSFTQLKWAGLGKKKVMSQISAHQSGFCKFFNVTANQVCEKQLNSHSLIHKNSSYDTVFQGT